MNKICALSALWLLLSACNAETEDAPAEREQQVPESTQVTDKTPSVPFSNAVITKDVQGKWSRSCVLCHVNGEGGAPRLGHPEEWQPRLAKGEAVLLQHAIEGYNNMPPLGYCQACEREDLRALIKLMSAGGS